MVRFNAEGPAGLLDHKAPGRASILNAEHRAALARAVEAGPKPYLDGVVRWRLIDLVQWLWDEFGISVSETTLGRELRALGFRKLSARPRACDQDPAAAEAFKKTSPPAWRKSRRNGPAASAWNCGFRSSPWKPPLMGWAAPAPDTAMCDVESDHPPHRGSRS